MGLYKESGQGLRGSPGSPSGAGRAKWRRGGVGEGGLRRRRAEALGPGREERGGLGSTMAEPEESGEARRYRGGFNPDTWEQVRRCGGAGGAQQRDGGAG